MTDSTNSTHQCESVRITARARPIRDSHTLKGANHSNLSARLIRGVVEEDEEERRVEMHADLAGEMTLDDAVRIALRRARDSKVWKHCWYWFAPPGWAKAVKNAPNDVVARASAALNYADRCIEDDNRRTEMLVELQVRTMLGSDHAADVLTEWALEHEDGTIPRIALARYLGVFGEIRGRREA